MITVKEHVFYLETFHTSYWFQVSKFGHLEHLHYGRKLPIQDALSIQYKPTTSITTTVLYDEQDENYTLDELPLEWSGSGMGDYRTLPMHLKLENGENAIDFKYSSYEVIDNVVESTTLPYAKQCQDQGVQSLIVKMIDEKTRLELELIYTVFPSSDCITRKVRITNHQEEDIRLSKIHSTQLDLWNRDFSLITFNGAWAKEGHENRKKMVQGTYVNASRTGFSGNKSNPGVFLEAGHVGEDVGDVYGVNLLYSGNHSTVVELNAHGLLRLTQGINDENFEWLLHSEEVFESPEAVMTYSCSGRNKAGQNFHDFVNHHIIPVHFQGKERPVVYNNWEATFFDFDERKLMSLAKKAKALGAECFVIDDGWFGRRSDDTKGLGDYDVNRKKFRFGLPRFVEKLHKMDLKVGLWFEPEMINTESKLFEEHPEYVIKVPQRKNTYGRHQLVLDLCQKEVRDYIIKNVSETIDACKIDYVKWDMNRHLSDLYSSSLLNQGEFSHRYILGLYEVLHRIFDTREHVLLESCASGGNRFDLGMMTISPQIWTSDDTDPIERLSIQGGISRLYPLSTISAHISSSPHQQTLRATPLSTRFNVAAFGVLGIEMDLSLLTREERKEIDEQIAFYKKHRKLFQFGTFSKVETFKDNQILWQVQNDEMAVSGLFQKSVTASPSVDFLTVKGLDAEAMYKVTSKPQRLMIERFGELIKHVSPVKLNPHGIIVNTVNQYYSMKDAQEEYNASGAMLETGIPLKSQFMGTPYNDQIRLLGDFGTTLYEIVRVEK